MYLCKQCKKPVELKDGKIERQCDCKSAVIMDMGTARLKGMASFQKPKKLEKV